MLHKRIFNVPVYQILTFTACVLFMLLVSIILVIGEHNEKKKSHSKIDEDDGFTVPMSSDMPTFMPSE